MAQYRSRARKAPTSGAGKAVATQTRVRTLAAEEIRWGFMKMEYTTFLFCLEIR